MLTRVFEVSFSEIWKKVVSFAGWPLAYGVCLAEQGFKFSDAGVSSESCSRSSVFCGKSFRDRIPELLQAGGRADVSGKVLPECSVKSQRKKCHLVVTHDFAVAFFCFIKIAKLPCPGSSSVASLMISLSSCCSQI